MADTTEKTATDAGEQHEQGKEQKTEFEAITSQDDFDKAIQARIARERAKFADYDDVKAKAARLTDLENENKTEAQKSADENTALKQENAELKSGKTRAEVAAAKGVPAGLLSGGTQEELEASADALIAFQGEKQTSRLLIPNEGNSPSRQITTEQEFVGELFNGGN